MFSIEEGLKSSESFKVYLAPRIENEARYCVTPKELTLLKKWMQGDRKPGDVWKTKTTAIPFIDRDPRFQVTCHGALELDDLIKLEDTKKEFIFIKGAGEVETIQRNEFVGMSS